jgi:hypothetical protein
MIGLLYFFKVPKMAVNHKPQTLNPKPEILNPKPSTPNPKPQTPDPNPQPRRRRSSTRACRRCSASTCIKSTTQPLAPLVNWLRKAPPKEARPGTRQSLSRSHSTVGGRLRATGASVQARCYPPRPSRRCSATHGPEARKGKQRLVVGEGKTWKMGGRVVQRAVPIGRALLGGSGRPLLGARAESRAPGRGMETRGAWMRCAPRS